MSLTSVNFLGVEAHAATKSQAKQLAERKIERVFETTWNPFYLKHGSFVAIIAADPRHDKPWGYTMIAEQRRSADCLTGSNYANRKEAISHAAFGLAQMASNHNGLEAWLSLEQLRDLEHHYEFLKRYAAAKADNKTDAEAHRIATEEVFHVATA